MSWLRYESSMLFPAAHAVRQMQQRTLSLTGLPEEALETPQADLLSAWQCP